MNEEARKWNLKHLALAVLFASILMFGGVAYLIVDVFEKKEEARHYPNLNQSLDDDLPFPKLWGLNFPNQLSTFNQMKNDSPETQYGGGNPYSKLIRFPQLTRLWAGYPFAADFNEEHSHYYTQLDQAETKRNDKAWLNANGYPKFKGQPGACMNCHSGLAPLMIRKLGWAEFNKMPYWDVKNKIKELDSTHDVHMEAGSHGSDLGSTCADCHHPKTMALRVTRPAYLNAMKARGYTLDPEVGIQATHQEMRSHVCQQCHVEYYFKPGTSELTFPWTDWPKNDPFKIEMLDTYYEKVAKEENGFKKDWEHKETGAPMLKMQHPEAEAFSSGLHARSGVACADCHMPYVREGANKVTDHNIRSPLNHISSSCGVCHRQSEAELTKRISFTQNNTAQSQHRAELAVLALIDDLKAAREKLGAHPDFANIADADEKKEKISEFLKPALEQHRRASMRWDFVGAENSTGFHFPEEAQRILGQAKEAARQGQILTNALLQKKGIVLELTAGGGQIPPAPSPIPR